MTYVPVTEQIRDLFKRNGIDPNIHHQLVIDLMHYVYDEREFAVDEVVGPRLKGASNGN